MPRRVSYCTGSAIGSPVPHDRKVLMFRVERHLFVAQAGHVVRGLQVAVKGF